MFVFQTLGRFVRFLRRPDQGSYRRMGIAFKFKTFFSLLLLNLVFSAVWLCCYTLISKQNLFSATLNLTFNYFWMFLVTMVFILPLVEEVVFRFPLKFERNYLLQLIELMISAFQDYEGQEQLENRFRTVWNRFFWVVLYVSASIFAFFHLFNYPDFKHLFVWFPLLTMVQFIMGLILSYLRIRFGFLWGLLYHTLYNLLVFGGVILLFGLHPWSDGRSSIFQRNFVPDPPDWLLQQAKGDLDFEVGNSLMKVYKVDKADYTLTIERDRALKGVPSYGVTPNKIFFDLTSIQYALRILSSDEITVTDPDSLMVFVELNMKTPQTSAAKARNILEKELFKAFDLK